MSDIEGKAARVAASECGHRASFNARNFHQKPKDGLQIRSKQHQITFRVAAAATDAKRRPGFPKPTGWSRNGGMLPRTERRRSETAATEKRRDSASLQQRREMRGFLSHQRSSVLTQACGAQCSFGFFLPCCCCPCGWGRFPPPICGGRPPIC